jgi:hypothetical protein
MAYEEVVVPRGTFIGFGEIGQTIDGEVLLYSDTEGSDYNDQPCPLVVIQLTQPATNYRNKGTEKETIAAGELVTVTCAQANLKSAARAANLEPGNLVRIVYAGNYKTAKGDGKEFKVYVDRTRRPTPAGSELV